MKLKNSKILLSVLIVPILLTGCSSGGVNTRYQDDRSNQMSTIPITEESYAFNITQSLSTISSLHYNLINQLNAVKNNYSDSFAKEQAKTSINSLKTTIQQKRDFIYNLEEPSTKTASKDLLVRALDLYNSQLSNAEVELTKTNGNIQSIMDSINAALENVKQHQF